MAAGWAGGNVYTYRMVLFYNEKSLELKNLASTALQSTCDLSMAQELIQSTLETYSTLGSRYLLAWLAVTVTTPVAVAVRAGLFDHDEWENVSAAPPPRCGAEVEPAMVGYGARSKRSY